MTSLGEILDQLRALGDDLQEMMDYSEIVPQDAHHRTAVFIRLPYPKIVDENEEVNERLARLLSSLNRPDTIKADYYTVIGKHILPGYQPYTELTANGDFDPDEIQVLAHGTYVLQVIVDVVQPAAMEKTLHHLDQLGE